MTEEKAIWSHGANYGTRIGLSIAVVCLEKLKQQAVEGDSPELGGIELALRCLETVKQGYEKNVAAKDLIPTEATEPPVVETWEWVKGKYVKGEPK